MAVFVLLVGVGGTLLFFSSAMISTEFARDLTTVTSHAEYIFEEMQTFKSLSKITGTDWSAWANQEGVLSLPQEKVAVQFSGPNDRPLKVDLVIAWQTRNKANTVNFKTAIIR